MKHFLLLIASSMLAMMILGSCTNEVDSSCKSFESAPAMDTLDDNLNEDPLIISLSELNDSLYKSTKVTNVNTRGWRDIFGFLKLVEIVYVDVLGGIKGAQWGSAGGVAGSIAGCVLVGIGTSALACCNFENTVATRISDRAYYPQSQVEAAYAYAIQDKKLQQEEIINCSAIKIQFPPNFESSVEVGLYHNIALKILNDELPSEYELGDYLTEEQMSILHSESFKRNYSTLLTDPNLFSMDYLEDCSQKEDRIIKLFLDVYKEYPEDLEDVNLLINLYIDRIEADSTITELQKQCVYSALSIAAYSTVYWSKQEDLKQK